MRALERRMRALEAKRGLSIGLAEVQEAIRRELEDPEPDSVVRARILAHPARPGSLEAEIDAQLLAWWDENGLQDSQSILAPSDPLTGIRPYKVVT